jgi:hypothetical protein
MRWLHKGGWAAVALACLSHGLTGCSSDAGSNAEAGVDGGVGGGGHADGSRRREAGVDAGIRRGADGSHDAGHNPAGHDASRRGAPDAMSDSARGDSPSPTPDSDAPDAGAHRSILVGICDSVGMGLGWSNFIITDGDAGPRGTGTTWMRIGETGEWAPGPCAGQGLNCDDGTLDYALLAGYGVMVILGDSACDMTLAEAQNWMTRYASYGSRIIWEYCNEPWNGNGSPLVPPGQIAKVYESIYDWKHDSGTLAQYPGLAEQPLVLQVIGEYEGIPAGQNGQWWLQRYMDADGGVPDLKVDGFSSHPYGVANTPYTMNDPWVLEAIEAERNEALSLGFSPSLPWYASEWGFSLRPDQGQASSYADQNSLIAAGLAQVATWPWLTGIWIYTSKDESPKGDPSIGDFGVFTTRMNADCYDHDEAGQPIGGCPADCGCNDPATPINNRPAFQTIVDFAQQHR